MMKKYLIILACFLVLCGCENKSEDKIKMEPDYVDLMNNNEYIIVDVRTKEEYDSGHIKDAINIPYDEIDENTKLDKSKMIFVYCLSGGRSSKAYDTLVSLGYSVYDLGAYENIDLPKE